MTETLPLEVTCQQVHKKLNNGDKILLLDCREQNEYELVKLEQATLLPMSEIQQRVDELQPHHGQEMIVHCHHGGRSLQVAMWLRQQGYPMAQSMAGGIDQWAVEIDHSLPRY